MYSKNIRSHYIYSSSNGLDKARPESGGTHIFLMSYTVSDHMYYQLYTWTMGLRESREAAEGLHRAGYLFPRRSVEASSAQAMEGKDIALKFNLSLNCTFCICIYMMSSNYRMNIYCIIFNLI